MLIPKQTGTANSCNTADEMEIFNFADGEGLLPLGWIHTHPSQTAFLSSVDLHTHCGYQLMLNEAIAIVCSVKYGVCRSFSLTRPHGLRYISGCRESGFHPHSENPPLYEESSHTRFIEQKLEFVDLR